MGSEFRWDYRRYFVDEAGDPTLFNRHGTPIVGRTGCSTHFLLGVVEVDDEAGMTASLGDLRARLLADENFNRIPSMQPSQRKTAEAFHANSDHSTVRELVFDLLCRQSFRFYAVVRDKQQVLRDVASAQRLMPSYRYSENVLYDSMVARLLRDRLHLDECEIVFARRGASNRTAALLRAIELAKERFQARWNQSFERQPSVGAAYPRQYGGLQAADYCLWALQRLIARADDIAWRIIQRHMVEVVVVKDGSQPDGQVFTPSRPLTLESWKKWPGI